MSRTESLREELVKLPRREYSELLRHVEMERRRAVERDQDLPHPGMNELEFARWIARQHYEVDMGIDRILFLPRDAPAGEVRLLEVNELAILPENGPVLAVDFLPDVEGIAHSLYVADVTPAQHDAIRAGTLDMPEGWTLEDSIDITPSHQ